MNNIFTLREVFESLEENIARAGARDIHTHSHVLVRLTDMMDRQVAVSKPFSNMINKHTVSKSYLQHLRFKPGIFVYNFVTLGSR